MATAIQFRKDGLRARGLASLGFIRAEQGSASVEFAATGVVLFMTMVGLMKICLAIYTYHFVSEAAHEATRFSVVRGSSCTGMASACPAVAPDIQSFVQHLGYPGITPALTTATTKWASYPSGACSPSSTCNNPGNLVTVTVKYAFPLLIPWMTSRTLTMTSTSSMVISQ